MRRGVGDAFARGGISDGTVTVTANTEGMDTGPHTAKVQVNLNQEYFSHYNEEVTVIVGDASQPVLNVDPTSLNFGTDTTTLVLSIDNASNVGTLEWKAAAGAGWATLSNSSGSQDSKTTVTVDRSSFQVGETKTTSIDFTSNGGNKSVAVSASNVGDGMPQLNVPTGSVTLTGLEDKQTFSIENTGSGMLNWSVSGDQDWLKVNPTSGVNDGTVELSVVPGWALGAGSHTATVTVTSDDGTATVNVQANISTPTTPVLSVTPQSLSFGTTTDELNLQITNTGSGDLNWTVSSSATYFQVEPVSGTNDANVKVRGCRLRIPSLYRHGAGRCLWACGLRAPTRQGWRRRGPCGRTCCRRCPRRR